MFKDKNRTDPTVRGDTRSEDAVFMGWQKMRSGDAFALYNITAAGHPSAGSTVTGDTLRRLNLHVPVGPLSRRQANQA